MSNRVCPPHMSEEDFTEAQRLYEVMEDAFAEERWRMCLLMASKKNGALLGQGEFELRERTLELGARTLEAAVNQRRKKGLPRQ